MNKEIIHNALQSESVWRFSPDPAVYGELLIGAYDWHYVIASLLIAALAAFATLMILDKIKLTEARDLYRFWLILACFTLSLGVWTMHFTGMIAFVLPRAMHYDPWVTALSVLPMLVGSWAALSILLQPKLTWIRIQIGALCLALGIGSMHYLGMEAMQIDGVNLFYDPWIFAVSILIAHGLACTVVYTYGIGEKLLPAFALKPATALLTGITISSMHYTAMLAASYVIDPTALAEVPHAGHGWLAIAVLCISTLILSAIALVSFIDNKLEHSNRSLARSERLILRAGKLAGIGGWELQNGILFKTPHLTIMLPILRNRSTKEFLEIVDPGNLASNINTAKIGEQLVQHVEILDSGKTRTYQSQCELIAPGHIFGYLQEITESMNREKALEAARELAEVAAMSRSQFVANMSHELRTPMNGVLGMTSLLVETELSEEQAGLVKVVNESGEAMLTVINEILDFSKLEAGEILVENITFDLERLVCECLGVGAATALEKNLQLHLSWQPDLPFYWIGDPTKIRQSLANLISNAIKFTEKGVVRVYVNRFQNDGQAGVKITVKDSGVGLTRDQLAKIFEPFHQADASTTRRFGGTGLGLSITKHLVDAMNGSLQANSEANQGATFAISLPINQDPDHLLNTTPIKNTRFAIISSNHLLVQETILTLEHHSVKVVAFNNISAFKNKTAKKDNQWHTVLVDASIFEDTADISTIVKLPPPETNVIVAAKFGISIDHHNIMRTPFGPSELLSRIMPASLEIEDSPDLNKKPEHRKLQNLQVLLAEDNLVNQKVALSMLSKLGMQADLAKNGQEALDAASRHDYDIILMDMQMPELDGLAATREIRNRQMTQPWIIATTANATDDDRERCLAAGMNDHLAKPMRVRDLENALARAPCH